MHTPFPFTGSLMHVSFFYSYLKNARQVSLMRGIYKVEWVDEATEVKKSMGQNKWGALP